MNRILCRLAVLLACGACVPAGVAVAADSKPAPMTEQQAATLREMLGREQVVVAGKVLDLAPLRRLYGAAGNEFIWVGRAERESALAAAYATLADDGLDIPATFSDPFKAKLENPVERDLLLSDAAVQLATALAVGRARPERWEEDWAVPAPSVDVVGGLERALRIGRVGTYLGGLAPSDPRYLRLKAALSHYRALAARGGWPQIKGGATIKPGLEDERVPVIRQRLIIEGYLPEDAAGDDTFDATLEAAVHVFQDRHGIVGDGAIGVRTIAAMNVTARARVEQIALTLERWRSLPRELGSNYIFVNVPAGHLEIFDNGAEVLDMKVVVGDPGHPTPVVQSRIAAVTFNPSWRVPLSIGKNEIAPKVKRDPHYLEKNDMVMKGAYYFEQLPGPKNPLGQIKFETPNKFDVYLHDTSSPNLFARAARALSHGCVRTERARDLAAYVLNPLKWTPDEIAKAVASNETQRVDVARHLRVNLFYFTSFVDSDGTTEFRDDIYGRDHRLKAALQGAAPTIAANPKQKPGVG